MPKAAHEKGKKKDKKKATSAKPLKKATRDQQRFERAKRNIRLATTAGFIEGMMNQMQLAIKEGRLELNKKEQDQMNRVLKYTDRAFKEAPMGIKSVESVFPLVKRAQEYIESYIESGPTTVGNFTQVWIAIGYIANEAKFIADDKQIVTWRFLASTVDTWTSYMLEHMDEDQEEVAGELAEKFRDLIIKKV